MAVADERTGATLSMGADLGPLAPALTLAPGTAVGRYRIAGVVGRGGMGVVYRAHDPELDRAVAVKLLPRTIRAPAQLAMLHRRLVREAQALAQIDHPNVLPVYDVGEVGAGVFVAMELIDGHNLRDHLAARPRSRAAILDLFLAAGHGLAAAHRAGLIHRDFKPDNVLVGRDGRVRVADFGLARRVEHGDDLADGAAAAATALTDPTLTAPGATLGTPAYMAPEQRRGEPCDARADQYAFCTALHEALVGSRPDEPSPTRPGGVPTALARLIARGRAAAAGDRFPDLPTLLAALARHRHRVRRTLGLGAVAAGALAAVAVGWLLAPTPTPTPAPSCAVTDAGRVGLWDDAQRADAARGFAALGVRPLVTWWQLDASLGAYRDAWLAARTDACVASRGRREPDAAGGLQVACLDRLRSEAQAVAELVRAPDAALAAHALAAAATLAPVSTCADTDALARGLPPPPDAETRAQVEALRAQLDRAAALHDAGRYRAAHDATAPLVAAAAALGYRPVLAEALFNLGRYQHLVGEPSAPTLDRALWEAEACGHDTLVAEVRLRQLIVASEAAPAPARLAELTHQVEATLLRLGDPPRLRGKLINITATAALADGHPAEALAGFERAEAVWRAVLRPDHPAFGGLANNACLALYQLGRYDQAIVHCERAISRWTAVLGADHGDLAKAHGNLGLALAALGQLDRAEAEYQRELALATASLGAGSPDLARPLANLGILASQRGDDTAALAYFERARALADVAGGDQLSVAVVCNSMGMIQADRGDRDAAAASYACARARAAAQLGPRHPTVAVTMLNQAELANQRGDARAARALLLDARAMLAAALGHTHPNYRRVVVALGQTYLALHDVARARAAFDDALTPPATDADAPVIALARFGLARALWPQPAARARARREVADALALARRHGPADLVDQIAAWQRRH